MSKSASSKPRPGLLLRSAPALMLFAFLLGCAGPAKNPTWSNATGAEQHERLMWQAIRNKDWMNFERRLAPAFVGVDAAGNVFDRAGWVDHWKQAGIGDYALGEVAVQPGGADLVITYVVTITGGDQANHAPASRLRVVSVWQQVKSRLILTASSLTPIQAE